MPAWISQSLTTGSGRKTGHDLGLEGTTERRHLPTRTPKQAMQKHAPAHSNGEDFPRWQGRVAGQHEEGPRCEFCGKTQLGARDFVSHTAQGVAKRAILTTWSPTHVG